LIPIAEDDGGNLICISCSDNDKGKIYFWNHEEENEDDLTANLYFVSNSFNEFIDSLVELE
jgi:SMI1-KNR4 cell-wall